MDFIAALSLLASVVELAAVNLLLGADNAVLIALACRPVPLELRQRVVLIGLAGAIVLRFALMVVTNALLSVPGVRLAAALFLISVSIWMLAGSNEMNAAALAEDDDASPTRGRARFGNRC